MVEGGQQCVEFLEAGDLPQGVTGLPTHWKTLEVPGHVLSHVNQAMDALIPHEQLGVTSDHRTDLTQGRQGGRVATGEGVC